MPTVILEAVATGVYNSWNLGAGASKVVAVQTPDDDNTTFIDVFSSPVNQSYTHDPMVGGVDQIVTVSVRSRVAQVTGTNSIKNFVRLGGSDVFSVEHVLGTYANYVDSLARPGGGAWQAADIDPSEMGIQSFSFAAGATRCTSLRMEVAYTEAGGGFIYLLSCWLPPILAVASHGLSRREIVHILRTLKVQPSMPEDFARLFAALRRRPRYAWL